MGLIKSLQGAVTGWCSQRERLCQERGAPRIEKPGPKEEGWATPGPSRETMSGLFAFNKVKPQHGNFVLLATVQMDVLKGLREGKLRQGVSLHALTAATHISCCRIALVWLIWGHSTVPLLWEDYTCQEGVRK